MNSWSSLLVFASLTSCQEPQPSFQHDRKTIPQPQDEVALEKRHAKKVSDLTGEWRVASVNGVSLASSTSLALRGTENELWWEPRCAGMARRYQMNEFNISFSSTEPPRHVNQPTRLICTIGLPPKLSQVFEALDGANRISRTPSNAILIHGAGHSVLLHKQ